MKKIISKISVVVIGAQLIVACAGDVRDSLGMRRQTPDEFKVVSHPSLNIPPDFFLRPPKDNKPKELSDIGNVGRKVVFEKASADVYIETTAGENSFLSRTGDADPKIKEILQREERELAKQEAKEGFFGKVSSLSSKVEGAKADSVVNAMAEKERIVKNKQNGDSVTNGDTPVVSGEKKGILGGIFGF